MSRSLVLCAAAAVAAAVIPPGGVPDTVVFEGGPVTGVKMVRC